VYRSRGASGLSRWVKRTLRTLLLAMGPILAVLVLLPGPVLEFAYGSGHAAADLPLILALAALAQCICFSKYPFDLGLLAMRSTRSIFLVYLIPVALLLTLGTALIYLLGILGVPLSAIAINSALLLATGLAYHRRMALERAAPGGGPR
jgi:O-antigen/teichoic acid export membrane protein